MPTIFPRWPRHQRPSYLWHQEAHCPASLADLRAHLGMPPHGRRYTPQTAKDYPQPIFHQPIFSVHRGWLWLGSTFSQARLFSPSRVVFSVRWQYLGRRRVGSSSLLGDSRLRQQLVLLMRESLRWTQTLRRCIVVVRPTSTRWLRSQYMSQN